MPLPVAMIGCRTTEKSLDCCEYDLAVFGPAQDENRVIQIDGYFIEVVRFAGPVIRHAVDLNDMQVLVDNNKFMLSSAVKVITPKAYNRAIIAEGRKSLVSSLFCQQKMRWAKHPVESAMWLKLAAYDFMGGILAMTGSKAMPLHELDQVRQINEGKMAEGIEIALESIGIERATRPTILRSILAIKQLKRMDYDRELFAEKVRYLLERSMLADSYYYCGRVVAKNLLERKGTFYSQYAKLVQIALDLSADTQHLEKLQKGLLSATKKGLNN